jgi:hypothetical protein
MQIKSIDFGLSNKTFDFMIGYFLSSQMRDEVGQTRYDGKGDMSKFVITVG